MVNQSIPAINAAPLLAELGFSYQGTSRPWASVLVDCPQGEGFFTYAIPSDLTVNEGDIVTVPFGSQRLGGIVVGCLAEIPADCPADKIKPIDDVVVSGFFAPQYWQLLHWVAEYYCTELITVIRMALPPGLLQRSQRRIRLNGDRLPDDWPVFLTQASQQAARQILTLLEQSKQGDYSYRYLQQKVKGAAKGIRDLCKRGWVESYLEPPKLVQAQRKKAVTLLDSGEHIDLTDTQQNVLTVLRRGGGEL
ncbi:MAG: Helicase PriA essential for oriC/DnaA-independent replication, partial [Cyanobacteriota bacterium]